MIRRCLFIVLLAIGVCASAQQAWKTFEDEEAVDQAINTHYSDRSGNFYLGTSSGLYIYHDSTWTLINRIESTADNSREIMGNVRQVWQDQNGNIWVACDRKLFVYNGKLWIHAKDKEYPGYTPRFFFQDSRGYVWICSEQKDADQYESSYSMPIIRGTVTVLTGDAWISCGYDAGGSDYVRRGNDKEYYTGILEDKRGSVWISSIMGLSIFTGAEWLSLSKDDLPSDYVNDMMQDRDENIWVATTGGVARFDGTAWTLFKHKDGIASGNAEKICQDRTGRIWAFLYGNLGFQGVSCFEDSIWTNFDSGKEIPSSNLITSYEDFSRTGIFMTAGEAEWFGGQLWIVLGPVNGLEGEEYFLMQSDTSGTAWISTDKGLFQGSGMQFTKLISPSDEEWEVTSMLKDSKGRIWLATADGRVYLEDQGKVTIFTESDGLPEDEVKDITEDQAGRIWLIYRKEIALYKF
jgi:ligand-binding sensor domain-containing protein